MRSTSWDIQTVRSPWGERPSIYSHILAHIRPGEHGLSEGGELLPDEELARGDSLLGWAPGALDGVFGHHADAASSAQAAQKILAGLQALTEKADDDRAAALYSLLTKHSALEHVDHLLDTVVAEAARLDPERLHAVARWLATGAADREPVKCAISLMGLFQGDHDRDLLLTLGRHEEFTLYVTVALQNTIEDSELSLWALACLVTGWGRIQIIERLSETNDEQIKAWLLREGYRNDIMDEYTALICAQTGSLLDALRHSDPDDKLLRGAGSILGTLIRGRGGPAAGIESYPEGAEAAELYLRHLQSRHQLDMEDLVAVSALEQFLNEEEGEAHDPSLGWLERRANLLELTGAIRSRPGWIEKVRAGMESPNQQTFWTATEAARALGIDIWEKYFERTRRGEDYWYFIMQTDDPERIEMALRLAEESLPLAEIATGPAEEVGFGPEFQHHSALDFVLQELRRFPGQGWSLIQAGLRSPVIRNRNMAVHALAAWERSKWPEDAGALLARALEAEPDENTRELMRQALASEPL